MRTPESTSYKKGQKRIEDIPGYALCTHCRWCALTYLGQIVEEGFWYCFYKKEWHRGYDILTYNCNGFRMKECQHCYLRKRCKTYKNPFMGGYSWCDKYKEAQYTTKDRFFVGRPSHDLGRLKDVVAKQMEKDFSAWMRSSAEEASENGEDFALHTTEWWEEDSSDHQADGGAAAGKPEEDKEGGRVV